MNEIATNQEIRDMNDYVRNSILDERVKTNLSNMLLQLLHIRTMKSIDEYGQILDLNTTPKNLEKSAT